MIAKNEADISEGLGANLNNNVFTVTGLTVNGICALSLMVNAQYPDSASLTGLTVLHSRSVKYSGGSLVSLTYVCMVLDSTATITFQGSLPSYHLMAYQV